ncbi:MAG TPA: TIGR02594 family protein [Longimicrobium sp.]|nr:TIGR02594 family protein [Longimicrobium sp.]
MANTVTITADSLNVRQGAGAEHPVITSLPKGTRLERLEESGGWIRVQLPNGATGWISAKFAAPDAAAPAQPAAAPAQPAAAGGAQLRVTATTLNVRSGPSKDGAVVTQLPRGMVVQQLEVSGDGQWTRVKSPGGFEGWVSSQFVVKSDGTDPDAPRPDDPAWYAVAWGERGQKEQSGPGHNPRILEYQTACSYNAHDEEVPWCSSFANWVMKKAGMKGSGEASARSWLTWGKKLDQPRRGAIAVLSRPGSPTNGHVTFYVGEEGGRLKLLGGNQENQVKISYYDKSRLLGYRWPA